MESEEKFLKRLDKLSKASPKKKKERLRKIEENEDRFVEDVMWRSKDRLEQDRITALEE